MADTTVELLLKTRFDGAGIEQAQQQINSAMGEIIGKMQGFKEAAAALEFSGDFDATANSALEAAEAFAKGATGVENMARAMISAGETKFGAKLQALAAKARGLSDNMARLGKITRQEILTNLAGGAKTLDQFGKNLDKATKEAKEMGEAAQRAGKWLEADVWRQRGEAIKGVARDFGLLKKEVKETLTPVQKLQQEFGDAFKGVKSIDQAKRKLKELKEAAEKARDAAFKTGDLGKALEAGGSAERVEQLNKALFGTASGMTFLGKEAVALQRVLQSTFNQLGFAMFVTTSTFRNLQMIMTGIIDAFREMNAAANRMVALSNAIKQAGLSQREFGESVKGTARGLIDQATLTTNTIKLLRQQDASLKSLNPLLVESAESLALVGGSGTDAAAAYTSIVDAVINGEGAIIESGGAVLDLSDAIILMEIAAARAGRELTNLEKTAIVVSVLEESVAGLNEEAAQMATIGDDMQSGAAALAETWETIKATAGTGVDTITSGATDLNRALFGTVDRLATANAMFGLLGRDGVEAMFALGDGANSAQKFVFSLVSSIVKAGDVVASVFGTMAVTGRQMVAEFAAINAVVMELAAATAAFDLDQMKNAASALLDLELASLDVGAIFQEQMSEMSAASDDFLRNFAAGIGIVIPEINSLGQAVANLAQGLSDTLSEAFTKGRLQNVIDSLKDLLGPERKLAQDIERIRTEAGARQGEIEQKFNDDTLKIREDAIDKRINLEEKHADKLNDIAADLSRKWARINEDSADKIEDIQEDAQDRREDEAKKKAEKIAKIEEDLQKKIDAILRKFELARLRALIDRDARALFEAEQRKREELAKAQETAKDKRDSAKEDEKKALDDINENEAKKLAREREAAEKRRRRAQEDAEIRRLETIEQFEAQNEQINELENERLAEAFARFKKERAQIKKEKEKRINDLKAAFEERMFLLQAQGLIEQAERLQQLDQTTADFQNAYDDWTTDFETFLTDYEGLVGDLIDLINSIGDATPGSVPLPDPSGGGTGGGGTGGGTGGCVSGADLSFTPSLGQPCSGVPIDRALIACNGSRWVCPSETFRWSSAGGGFGAQTTSTPTSPGLLGATAGGTDIGTGLLTGGTRLPVTIEVQGDETLEEIFKSLAYESFIEVTS